MNIKTYEYIFIHYTEEYFVEKFIIKCIKCSNNNSRVNIHKGNIDEERRLNDLAELFKILGDSNRMKILFGLLEGEMCVCDIVNLLGMTQSAVSHQLRILKQSRLVRVRKQGKSVYYSLNDNYIRQIFNYGLNHIKEIYNV